MNRVLLLAACFLTFACSKSGKYQIFEDINKKDLRVKSLGKFEIEKAKTLLADRKNLVLGMLEPSFDPYVGEVLLPEKCRKEKLPAPKLAETEWSINSEVGIYSSKEKILGHCSNPDTLLKSHYQILYCKKSKELFSATYYYSDDESWREKPLLKCPSEAL